MEGIRTILDRVVKIEIDFAANKDCADVMLDIFCDDQKFFSGSANSSLQTVLIDLVEDTADHVLRLEMTGKKPHHTIVSSNGDIVDDVYFRIIKLEFEGLDLRDIFCLGHQCYTHSFNGSRPEFVDEFYGQIGCNGVICMQFKQPFFLWLDSIIE